MAPRHSYCSFFTTFVLYFLVNKGFCDLAPPEFEPIYLTLSSLYREPTHSTNLIDREIQIHWRNGTVDKISLYNEEPGSGSEAIFQFGTAEYPDCFIETKVSLGNPVFPGGWERGGADQPLPGEYCLPAWVVGYLKGEIVFSNCLKIRPTWMQDNRFTLEHLKITTLFLPGTHNSGSYKRGETLSHRDTSGRYILTQEQSIWNQLVYGVRYLDLRIGYYPVGKNESATSDNCFWINHDLIKVRHLPPLLEELKTFLKKTKDEVVVVDLHRFPAGFNGRQARHLQLVRYLERELAEFAMPYRSGYIPSLGDIWDQGKRLIISYGEPNIGKEYEWLWPPVRQLWGNKQSVDTLFDYLDSCMHNDSLRDPERGLWAAMAELTPGPMDLLLRPKGSLREMAHRVNRRMTSWCRNFWWHRANIVALDFFLGTDIISTAVASNVFKGSALKHYTIE